MKNHLESRPSRISLLTTFPLHVSPCIVASAAVGVDLGTFQIELVSFADFGPLIHGLQLTEASKKVHLERLVEPWLIGFEQYSELQFDQS